jgi:hypothetical protein
MPCREGPGCFALAACLDRNDCVMRHIRQPVASLRETMQPTKYERLASIEPVRTHNDSHATET